MKLSRYLFSILLFIFLTEPIFYPLSSSAATYQALSKIKTAGILNTVRASLKQHLVVSFSDPDTDIFKEGAIAITTKAVGHKIVQFYFREIPGQISKKILLETVKLGYRLLSTSGTVYALLDTLEKVTVAEANQIAMNWLTQNNIKASGGDINFQYISYQGEKQEGHLQYIILVHPQIGNQAKIIAAFYSSDFLIPADSRASIPWPFEAWRQQRNSLLNPFIIEIEGQVQMDSATGSWINDPALSVNFPGFVPQFSFNQSYSVLLHPFSWLKKQWNNLLSPAPQPQEIVITPQNSSAPEMDDLKQTVQSLKEIIDQQSTKDNIGENVPEDNSFLALAEGLKDLATALGQQDKNNTETLEQINQIAQSQAEIAKIQAQKAVSLSVSTEDQKEENPVKTSLALDSQLLLCPTDNLHQPSWNQVIFNEIAWMGTQESSNNEWLELKSVSSQPVNLDGWQIFNKNQNLVIHFGPEDQLLPNRLFLLERTDDGTLPYKKADKIYQGGIKNSEETLYFFNTQCQLQDLIEANPNWPAGSNSSRRTMERKTNLEWQTSYPIEGTPKSKNSQGYNPPSSSSSSSTASSSSSNTNSASTSENSPEPLDNYPPLAKAGPDQTIEFSQPIVLDASQSGDNVGIVSYKWDTNDDGLWNVVKTEPTLTLESGSLAPGEHLIILQVADATGYIDEDQVMITVLEIPQIVISEIQTAGENSQDEFVELFNPNQREVNLFQWSLKKKTASGTEMNLVSSHNSEEIIPSQGYFLVVPPVSDDSHGYQGIVAPDIYYSSQSNSIADNNTVLLYNPLGQLADKVGFGQEIIDFEGQPYPENPGSGLSLGRKWNPENQTYQDTNNNQEDFELGIPTPKSQNQTYQAGPVLTAVNFSIADDQTGSLNVTTQSIISVSITGDQAAAAWLLSESQNEQPAIDNSHWLTEKPEQFTLSTGDGAKTVFLWLKDQNNSLSPQYSASITLDEHPPQAILNLALYPTKNNGEILLSWTTPGEPESESASRYIIKCGAELITEDKWEAAEIVSQNLEPQEPKQAESFIISGLDPSQIYYFAIKSQDEWDVSSPISNSPSRRAMAASGTPEDPYIIINCQDLQDINLNLNAAYQLAHSIDCSATIDWNDGLGFDPLGDNAVAFTGSLDGHDYTIDNFHINRTIKGADGYYVGLVGQAKAGAQITHLGLRNADIRGYQYVGGFVGWARGSNSSLPIAISDCYATGYLASSRNDSKETFVGGLIGSASSTEVNRSWSSMEIDASQANIIGGLIGEIHSQTNINHSYATGKTSGHQTVGGLVGRVRKGASIKQCWSQGEVSGDKVGGLVGENSGNIENSYAQAKVSITGNSGGGFAAFSTPYGSIANSYATGYVSGASKSGFIQSPYNTSVQNCYWDMNSSGQASSGRGTGLTTDQMKNSSNFSNWDFNSIWKIEAGRYPGLRE